jgi:heme exporter protein A
MINQQLEAINLCCIRDERVLFNDLNFVLESGQVLLIEGANGAGKTSLLRILTGLRKADVGQLKWNGEMIDDVSVFYQAMAYISHHNALKTTLTAQENLQYAQSLTSATLSTDAVLAQVGLSGYQDTLVRFVSAGSAAV